MRCSARFDSFQAAEVRIHRPVGVAAARARINSTNSSMFFAWPTGTSSMLRREYQVRVCVNETRKHAERWIVDYDRLGRNEVIEGSFEADKMRPLAKASERNTSSLPVME
jgi:hypothetical protein